MSSSSSPMAGNLPSRHVIETENGPQTITTRNMLQLCKPITQRILLFCLLDPVKLPPATTEPRRALSQTCQLWREIVLSTPEFWENILFSPGPFNSVHKLVGIARQALQRSGLRPLNLDFVGHSLKLLEKTAAQSDPDVENLVYGRGRLSIMRSIVLPNRHRVRSLRFVVCTHEDFNELLNISGPAFPQLVALDVAIPPGLVKEFIASLRFPGKKPDRGLNTFPGIARLSLHLLDPEALFHPYNMRCLRWKQLSDLDIGTVSIRPNVFTKIMRRLSLSLTRTSFCIKFATATQPSILPKLRLVNMPLLFSLHLTLRNPSQDPRLFNLLYLPALKYLQINIIDKYTTTCDLTMFTNMINRIHALEILEVTHVTPKSESPPSVRRGNNIMKVSLKKERLIKFFMGLPYLRVLFLPDGMHLQFNIINRLAHGELLPSLTKLKLTVADDWDYIMAMILARIELAMSWSSRSDGSSFRSPHRRPSLLTQVDISMPQFAYSKRKDILDDNSLPTWVCLDSIADDLPSYYA